MGKQDAGWALAALGVLPSPRGLEVFAECAGALEMREGLELVLIP